MGHQRLGCSSMFSFSLKTLDKTPERYVVRQRNRHVIVHYHPRRDGGGFTEFGLIQVRSNGQTNVNDDSHLRLTPWPSPKRRTVNGDSSDERTVTPLIRKGTLHTTRTEPGGRPKVYGQGSLRMVTRSSSHYGVIGPTMYSTRSILSPGSPTGSGSDQTLTPICRRDFLPTEPSPHSVLPRRPQRRKGE